MTVNILAALLSLLAAYLGFWAVAYNAPLWWLGSAFGFIIAAGLLLRKPWARGAWYILAFVAVAYWLFLIARMLISGWPDTSVLTAALSLLPGALLLLTCIAGSYVVNKHY